MKVIRARHLGMCFGVRDAIQMALNQTKPVTILGDLVHNQTVLSKLRDQGVNIAHQAAQLATQNVMITAHGASDRDKQQLRDRGHLVIEATCPLVHYAHLSLKKLADQGYHPVIIGQRNHVEVRGMTGDYEAFDVVLSAADIDALAERDKFGVVAQTTQPFDRVRELVCRLEDRFPDADVRWVDTVCQPTKQRQDAAVALAQQSDVVIVVGGANSNNTAELARTCRTYCPNVHHVQGPDDIEPAWLDQAEIVGLTAGTSTPDEQVDAVEFRLRDIAAVMTASRLREGQLCAR